MGNISRTFLPVLISISFLLTGITFSSGEPEPVLPRKNTRSGNSLIHIDNETDLSDTASIEGWPGDGSKNNPYIISGMERNITGYNQGIYIGNTTSHIVIRNCNLTNGTRNGPYNDPAGIRCRNITNVTISKCSLIRNWKGIDIRGDEISIDENNISYSISVGVTVRGIGLDITNNTMINNEVALEMIYSSESRIMNNSLNLGTSGMYLASNDHFRIYDNRVSNQTNNGLLLASCGYFSVFNNTFDSNDNGIYSYGGYEIVLENNVMHDNLGHGMEARNSREMGFHNNTLHGNDNGLHLMWSSNSWVITGNRIFNCMDGINAQRCTDLVITNNNISNCDGEGILVHRSRVVRISDNILERNFYHGMDVEDCSSFNISNNTLLDNKNGLDISDGFDFLVEGNQIRYNRGGCFLSNMDFVDFVNNSVSNNGGHGLILATSDNITIRNNSFWKNSQYGVYLLSGKDCIIHRNTFLYNMGTGDTLNETRTQAYDGTVNNLWSRSEMGNYWRDHRSPDNDGNGIVDVPYNMSVTTNVDPYPLVRSNYPTPPGIPVDFNTTPGNEMVHMEWSEPVTDGGSDITGYNVYRSEDAMTGWSVISRLDDDSLSFNDTGLVNGVKYYYMVGSVNSIGSGGLTEILSAIPDGDKPRLIIDYPIQNSYISDNMVKAVFHAEDDTNEISGYRVKYDDNEWMDNGLGENFTMSDLGEGDHTFTVRAYDLARNYAESSTQFTVDTVPPDLIDIDPENGTHYNRRNITVRFGGTDETSGIDHFQIKLDDWGWIDLGMEAERAFTDLGPGNHTIIIRAVDMAGNTRDRVLIYNIDLNNPHLNIVQPTEGIVTNKNNLTAVWVGGDNEGKISHYRYRLNSGPWTALNDSMVELVDLEEGDHRLTVQVFDEAGNHMTSSINFSVDSQPPVVVEYGPTGELVQPNEEIFVVFNEPVNRTISDATVNGRDAYFIWTDLMGMIDFGEEMKYNTEYVIEVTGRDLAGNLMETFSWTFETTNIGTITGKVHDYNRRPMENVEILLDGNEVARTDEEGVFSLDLESGRYDVTAKLDGYTDESVTVDVEPGEETDIGIITLQTDISIGVIKGRIVDQDGSPIEGAIVTISSIGTETTDENGIFTLEGEVGYYNMTVERTGYEDSYKWVNIPKDSQNDIGDMIINKETTQGDDEESSELSPVFLLIIFLAIIAIGLLFLSFLIMRKRSSGELTEE